MVLIWMTILEYPISIIQGGPLEILLLLKMTDRHPLMKDQSINYGRL